MGDEYFLFSVRFGTCGGLGGGDEDAINDEGDGVILL